MKNTQKTYIISSEMFNSYVSSPETRDIFFHYSSNLINTLETLYNANIITEKVYGQLLEYSQEFATLAVLFDHLCTLNVSAIHPDEIIEETN